MGILSDSVVRVAGEKPKSVEALRSGESVVALEMMANGARMVDVEEATGISVYTLMRMRMDHGAAVAERRKVAAEKAEMVAEQYGELMMRRAEQLFCSEEGLAKINPKDLAVAYGIMQDHRAKLSGEAVAVVEHRKVLGIEEAKAMIEAARQRVREEAIDV